MRQPFIDFEMPNVSTLPNGSIDLPTHPIRSFLMELDASPTEIKNKNIGERLKKRDPKQRQKRGVGEENREMAISSEQVGRDRRSDEKLSNDYGAQLKLLND